MKNSIPSGYAYHAVFLADHAGLTCRFLKPVDFTIADLPPETPDFSNGAQFMPLGVALTQFGPMVFTVAARPAFDDGTVATGSPTSARRKATRTAQDGGRLFQMATMAPAMLWPSAIEKLAPMLASLELREVRGTKVAMVPDTAKSASTPSVANPQKARLNDTELAALALASEAASLDNDHPMNARLRNTGVGPAEDQAKFDALDAGTPIPTWFPYTRYGAPEARRATALRHITARPDFVAELAALMVDADDGVPTNRSILSPSCPNRRPPCLRRWLRPAGRSPT